MRKLLISTLLSALFASATLPAAFTFTKEGKLINADDLATMTVQEHYDAGLQAIENENWREARKQFRIVSLNFLSSNYSKEALYYLGVSYYNMGDMELANKSLSKYLDRQLNPAKFEDAVAYKFKVAEKFRKGAKRHLLGSEKMPKWIPGAKNALEIYDEVIAALPNHNLAARSLFLKGCMLKQMKRFHESVDAFQTLVKRFPKHELAIESHLCIIKNYYNQSLVEKQNPDLLPLATINLERFKASFPGSEKVSEGETYIMKIKEIYANGLFETASFYERTKRPRASSLYYYNAIKRFPETEVADKCRLKLMDIDETEHVVEQLHFDRELINGKA